MISHFTVAPYRCLGLRVVPHAMVVASLKKVWHSVWGVALLWYTLSTMKA